MKLIYRVVRGPRCTSSHIKEFTDFLKLGGQVAGKGLDALLRRAPFLAECKDDNELVGFAGIKDPRESYVERIFESANFQGDPLDYRLELGWAYTNPLFQKKGICRELFERLLSRIPDSLVYATTEMKSGKPKGMRKILTEFNFQIVGNPYPASDPTKSIQLYIKGL